MPFPQHVREDALVKSCRCCCVCRKFVGRPISVHHIVQEADGGENTIDNAIVLCLRCHSEAGHYNPRHPIGAKYSPGELRRLRDQFWDAVAQGQFHSPVPDLEIEWSKVQPSDGDLHTYLLKVFLTNGAILLEHWKLQIAVPCYIPVTVEKFTKIDDKIRDGVRYIVHEVAGTNVFPGQRIDLAGLNGAYFKYQMTHEIYYAVSKTWVCAWHFYNSAGLPVEGVRPWEHMHEF